MKGPVLRNGASFLSFFYGELEIFVIVRKILCESHLIEILIKMTVCISTNSDKREKGLLVGLVRSIDFFRFPLTVKRPRFFDSYFLNPFTLHAANSRLHTFFYVIFVLFHCRMINLLSDKLLKFFSLNPFLFYLRMPHLSTFSTPFS